MKLKQTFREYNKKYFHNQIPDYNVKWARLEDCWGYQNTHRKHIRIDKTLNKGACCAARLTLLHEMVHAYLCTYNRKWEDHGYYFNREMLRLAKEGAFNGIW